MEKYARAGVNVSEGDKLSSFAAGLCRKTWGNSPFVRVHDLSHGNFRGPRPYELIDLPEGCLQYLAPDGDGTKVVLMDAAGAYPDAAYGFTAMTRGDITRWGGCAPIVVNILDTLTIGKEGDAVNNAYRAMLTGLQRIAGEQGFVMLNGEIAELPGCVTSPNPAALASYLWSGVAVGICNPKTVITGDQLRPGLAVMALREPGFRNNGSSLVREIMKARFGPNYYSAPEAYEYVQMAAVPAMLFDRFLETANGWYAPGFEPLIKMYLIAHLTGGGIKSKFVEDILFPRGFSTHLGNLWEPPDIMRQCAKWGGVSDDECYHTWHGGQGVLVVIDSSDEQRFVHLARSFGVEARLAGWITKESSPTAVITSKFTGETITWSAK